jgi:large subunit ribosomal protein L28
MMATPAPGGADSRKGMWIMAGTCDLCGKTKSFGHNVSFSKRHTNRAFKANIQRKRLTVGGVEIRVNVCTRCMRTMGKTSK